MINFFKLVTPFFFGTEKIYARCVGLWLLLLTQSPAVFGYLFIQWNRRFYDALEAKDSDAFFTESLIFAGLALALGLIESLARYTGQKYALRWRMWMTTSALKTWLHDPKRGELEGSDQRIQEDLMRFTTIFEKFFLGCFGAIVLILFLIPMLFSQAYQLRIGNMNLAWTFLIVSVIYTLIGIFISAKIANPLIKIEYDNQKIEANFRYNLVHVRDGANKDLGFFEIIMNNLTENYHLSYNRQKYYNIWQKWYDQFSFLIPFGLLASNYFIGVLTLGMLMQIKSIFSRIRNAMAYLLDHYTEFTEMMAISRRLLEFYKIAEIKAFHHNTMEQAPTTAVVSCE